MIKTIGIFVLFLASLGWAEEKMSIEVKGWKSSESSALLADKLLVQAFITEDQGRTLYCISTKTGKKLWQRKLSSLETTAADIFGPYGKNDNIVLLRCITKPRTRNSPKLEFNICALNLDDGTVCWQTGKKNLKLYERDFPEITEWEKYIGIYWGNSISEVKDPYFELRDAISGEVVKTIKIQEKKVSRRGIKLISDKLLLVFSENGISSYDLVKNKRLSNLSLTLYPSVLGKFLFTKNHCVLLALQGNYTGKRKPKLFKHTKSEVIVFSIPSLEILERQEVELNSIESPLYMVKLNLKDDRFEILRYAPSEKELAPIPVNLNTINTHKNVFLNHKKEKKYPKVSYEGKEGATKITIEKEGSS